MGGARENDANVSPWHCEIRASSWVVSSGNVQLNVDRPAGVDADAQGILNDVNPASSTRRRWTSTSGWYDC